MSHVKESVLHFPCDYVIKVEGRNIREFEPSVCEIVSKHVGKLDAHQITVKRKKKTASITIRIVATSREQINTLNSELASCSAVDFIL